MLARRYRLTSGTDISHALRHGDRFRLPCAQLSLWITGGQHCPQVGLAVGKPVGNSVVRSLVSRRLRHGIAPLVDQLPRGSWLVIRAFPGADAWSSTDWTHAIQQALGLPSTVDNSVDMFATPEDDTLA